MVVAIIAILAAMLLPVLSRARESARRAVCLSDRRQNGVAVHLWADDHDENMPTATSSRDANGYKGLEPSSQIHWHGATNHASPAGNWFPQASQTHEATDPALVFATGTLLRFGYIGDPALLYCPSWKRDGSPTAISGMNHYTGVSINLDTDPMSWNQIKKGELTFSNRFRHYTGICHQFWVKGADPTFTPPTGAYTSQAHVKLRQIADSWRTSSKHSPIFYACAQFDFYNHGATTGDPALHTKFGLSHFGEGSSTVFYDGSARFVKPSEVKAAGWQASTHSSTAYAWRETYDYVWLFNRSGTHDGNADNFVMWGRKAATPDGI